MILGLCLSAPFVFAHESQKTSAGKVKPPASTSASNNQWALLVGISHYPGQIQSLTSPRDDARAIKDLLVGTAGFSEDHVRLLTDDEAGDAKATKQNILAAVDNYLAPRVQPGHEAIGFLCAMASLADWSAG